MVASSARPLEEPTSLVVFVPLRTKSESNRSRHEHWSTTRARVQAQHEAVLQAVTARATACPWPPPLVCRLTRFSFGRLDTNNVGSALKHVQDALARHWFHIDDRHDHLVSYELAQRRCARGEAGVLVEVFPLVTRRTPPPPQSPV